MTTINSISGGKTSAYVAANYPADHDIFALVRVEDEKCKFPDRKVAQMVSDKIGKDFIGTVEDDAIIYTILDLEQYIGREVTWVSGDTFESIIKTKGDYLPNKVARYCTTYMKTYPIASYLYENGLNKCDMRFGYRANEQKRAKSMNEKKNENGFVEVKITIGKHKNGNNKWKTIEYVSPSYPLISDGIFKDTINEFWKDKGVRFAKFNNCVGCWWRNPMFLKMMHISHPNKMQWFADQEKKTGNRFKTEVSYKEIINYKPQAVLFEDDFNECDSGYCGL